MVQRGALCTKTFFAFDRSESSAYISGRRKNVSEKNSMRTGIEVPFFRVPPKYTEKQAFPAFQPGNTNKTHLQSQIDFLSHN